MIKHKDVIKYNILKFPYPFEDKSFDQIYLFHTIEHVPDYQHPRLLCEMRRVLVDNGQIAISYPEFIKIALNYINNVNGDREFWKRAIYGRGSSEWDRHKALMNTEEFSVLLYKCGFKISKSYPEVGQPFNTVVIVEKGEIMPTYEDIMQKEYS